MALGRYWDLVAGVVILLGLMQLPGDMQSFQPGIEPGFWALAAAFVDIVPALPLLLAIASLLGGRVSMAWAVGLILASFIPATVLILATSYDTGGGEDIIGAEGLALTLGCLGMLICLTGKAVIFGRFALGVPVLAALWSLGSIPAATWSARAVANGAPYCIARHEVARPIRSFAELRGVSFHTNKSGYKDTSRWFLHGVLLAQRGNGIEAWNWSPRQLRFERIKRPEDMIESPFGVCVPKDGFLRDLDYW